MKYFGKLLKSSKEVIILYLLNYLIIIGSCILYHLLGFKNLDEFILNILPYITILYNLIVVGIILLKKEEEKKRLKIKNIFTISSFGVSLAIILNFIIFLCGIKNTPSDIKLLTLIVSSAVIGPMFEELVFRKIFLNKLLEFNNKYAAVLINTIIFALIHGSISGIIYAFIFGLMFNLVYLRYKNIWANIIMHISGNMIVLFLTDFNIYIFLVSLLILVLSYILVFRKYKA